MITNKKKRVLSLFTGAGGLDLGFHECGFEIILASDHWKHSELTFKENFPNTPFLCEDIQKLSSKRILKATHNIKPEIIIGGPPCQGFSQVGDKNSSDPRNLLFEHYVRLVDELKPECFIFENVKGIKSMFSGRYLERIINSFANCGYNIYYKTLNAKNYGVPQSRERVIIFGTRLENNYIFPIKLLKKTRRLKSFKNCGDALRDLDSLKNITSHIKLNHGEKVLARYKLVKPGCNLPSPDKLPASIRRASFGNTYYRLDPKTYAPTMVPGNNAFPIHPWLDRSLTPREAARVQSFPDKFVFIGPRKEQCKLVGNAVPPLMAYALAESIKMHLKNQIKGSEIYFEKNITHKISSKSKKEKEYTCIDLFSGAGGFVRGFKNSRYKVLLSADFDLDCEKTHNLNYPDIPFVKGDLSSNLIFKKIIGDLKNKEIDVVVGGPPCQGFSIFGKRRFIKTKDYNPHSDDRNKLVFSYLKYVKALKPKWFLMENVPGLTSLDNGWFLESLVKEIKKMGYKNVEYRIINTADYGVPQTRKRFLLIANRLDYIIPWPKEKYFDNPEDWQLPYRTVGETILDLSSKKNKKVPNHEPMKHADSVIRRFSYIKEGKKINPDDLPEDLKYSRSGNLIKSYSKVFYRLSRNEPSPTLVPGHNAFPIHPIKNRQITIREAARLQTFPDDVVFSGGSGSQCKQVGNAFPVLAAEYFANHIIKAMENCWKKNSVSNLAQYSLLHKTKK